jgi:hypothetical protein
MGRQAATSGCSLRRHVSLHLGVVGQILGVLRHGAMCAQADEVLAQFVGGQVGTVAGGTGLLAPRIMQAAVVHRIKAQCLNQSHDFLFGRQRIAGHRQGDAALGTSGCVLAKLPVASKKITLRSRRYFLMTSEVSVSGHANRSPTGGTPTTCWHQR